MEKGNLYNLTAFSMCAHNGTHIDAPFHFIKGGKTVDSIGLDTFVGMAYVAEYHGIVSGTAAPLNVSGADGSPCRAILIAAERKFRLTKLREAGE